MCTFYFDLHLFYKFKCRVSTEHIVISSWRHLLYGNMLASIKFIYLFILNQALAIRHSFYQNSVTTSYTFYEFNWDCIHLISYFYEQMLYHGAFPSVLFSLLFLYYLSCWIEGHCPRGFYSLLEAVSSFTAFFIASALFFCFPLAFNCLSCCPIRSPSSSLPLTAYSFLSGLSFSGSLSLYVFFLLHSGLWNFQ